MTTVEIKKRLIDKILKTDNDSLLEEAYRLFELEDNDLGVYELSGEQKLAVHEAMEQIKRGDVLTSDQADNEIDIWLKE
jgi:hypothetical protein